ncbi:MAG: nuclear transport factor 2 family protein [Gemmatimonadales bacterium]
MRVAVLMLAAATVGAAPVRAQNPKEAVLAAAQGVFDAMARKDTVALRRLMHPLATLIATVETGDSVRVNGSRLDQFLSQIAGFPTTPIERMWNAEVRVSGAIATVWTQYDFHRDREFSHCGIDAFQLVRTDDGWKVSSIIYTVVRPAARCQPNPIGPPR